MVFYKVARGGASGSSSENLCLPIARVQDRDLLCPDQAMLSFPPGQSEIPFGIIMKTPEMTQVPFWGAEVLNASHPQSKTPIAMMSDKIKNETKALMLQMLGVCHAIN